MSLIPPKYRFFINMPGLGERELFPLYDPGAISFSYDKWNDYTEDFKIKPDDEFIFRDNPAKQNTISEIHKPYSLFKSYADILIQSVDIIIRVFEGGLYRSLLVGRMKILDSNKDLFINTQKKFAGKLETISQQQTLENLFDVEVNILETSATHKQTATLVSTGITYNNCFELGGVIQYVLDTIVAGVNLRANPWPYITDELLIENLLIADKTDIKRPNASSNATINKVSLVQILEWMQNMFNLKYRISATNELYFEHPSEINFPTQEITNAQILNFKTLGFGFETYPKSNLWKYSEAATNGFIQQLIEFNVNEGPAITYNIENVNNDIEFINNNNTAIGANPDAKDEVADVGVCFIATDSSQNIYEVSGVPNSKLQLDFLVQNCFYYDLYFNEFTQNGTPVIIISNRKRRKSVIKINKFTNFTINSFLQTSFGTCEIESMKQQGEKLEIELKY